MTQNELRNKYVSTAKSYLGATKGSSKHLDIVNTYNSIVPLPQGYKLKTSDAWCAATVSAMAKKVDILDLVPAECSCPRMITLMKQKGIWVENDAYVPSAGDILMYDWDDSGNGDNIGTPDHVGIVCGVEDGEITVIEGNKGSPAQVGYRIVKLNGKYIRGFGVPKYSSKATEADAVKPAPIPVKPTPVTPSIPALPTLQQGSKGMYVESMQNMLLYLGYTSLGSADGDFGAKTKKALINFQNKYNLVPDGICGSVTWKYLKNAMPTLQQGSRNKAVIGLQLILRARGYTDNNGVAIAADGVFGACTAQAVKKFQKAAGLEADGVVGPLTKAKL